MPTEARGNYLPEPPYLRETKTHHSQPVESIRHAGNFFYIQLSIRPIIIFLLHKVMSNYLTSDGLKNFSLRPEAPLRPEARGICHICHMVNLALLTWPWPRPFQGRFFIGWVGLAMLNQCTKFVVARFTGYEAMNGGAKCRTWGGLGCLAGTQGQRQCHQSIERIWRPIRL